MKIMKKLIGLTAIGFIASSALFAQTVTLQIQTPNFADRDGNPVAPGTPWGIVFDLSGDIFTGGGAVDLQLDPFTSPLEMETRPDAMLSRGFGTSTSDLALAYVRGSVTIPVGPNAGPGAFTNADGVRHLDGTGLAADNMQFGVIWFPGLSAGDTPGAGDAYGFYTNDNLRMPSSSVSARNFSEFISNTDIKTAQYSIVPEPSTYAAIFGFGVLLFVFLRRRFKK
jgi:hypothetical protein